MPRASAAQLALRPAAAAAAAVSKLGRAPTDDEKLLLLDAEAQGATSCDRWPCSSCGGDKQRPPSRLAWLGFLLLSCTYIVAYAVSLQGGSHSRDLAFINAHLNAIGQSLVAAIAAFTGALWVAGLLGPAAWPARAALGATHVLLLALDHGGDFASHGFYNW